MRSVNVNTIELPSTPATSRAEKPQGAGQEGFGKELAAAVGKVDELQVAAEHGALRAHLTAPRYRERAKESAERFRYVLDRSAFDARWKRSVDWIEGRTSEAPSE